MVTRVGSMPPVTTYWDYVAVLVFIAMLILVTAEVIPIVQAAISALAVMVLGG